MGAGEAGTTRGDEVITTELMPETLGLGEVIARLEREDPAKPVAVGFARPHSYRGYYAELAFEVERDTTVGDMLAAARSALGATFEGWKGGDYEMSEYTTCWLVREEGYTGETVGALLLEYMLVSREAS